MAKTLFILNDPPYGTERSYNGMRLIYELIKGENDDVRVFLIADSVACAKKGQQTPNGYYNMDEWLRLLFGRMCWWALEGLAVTPVVLALKSTLMVLIGVRWLNLPNGQGGPTRLLRFNGG